MKMLKKILICLLIVALVIPMGAAFADTEYCCGVSYSTVKDENGNYESAFKQFKTNQEYKDYVNTVIKDKPLESYTVDIYSSDLDLIIKKAQSVYINGRNNNIIFSSHDIVLEKGSIELMVINGCKLTGDYEFTIRYGCSLHISNRSIYDGLNRTYTHDIFNLEQGGRLQIDNSYIQNFYLEDNSEIVDFVDDTYNDAHSSTVFEGLNDAEIINIHSDDHGIIRMNNGRDMIQKMRFTNCSSEEDGGVIYLQNGFILNSKFFDCSSDGDGGAIYAAIPDYVCARIQECTFNTCKADEGGAIYIESDTHGPVDIYGCYISGSSANYGGGIYIDAPGVNIQNSEFSYNHAYDDGGGIYVNQKIQRYIIA